MHHHSRRSLCMVHRELGTAGHYEDAVFDSNARRLYEDAESLALNQLVELKTTLRKASQNDFWQVLCRDFAQIAQSQSCLVILRVSDDSKLDFTDSPAEGGTRSGMGSILYYYRDRAGYNSHETNTSLRTFNCPCSFLRSDKRVLVPENNSHDIANNLESNHLAFPCDAYLSIPLFAFDECIAHFCVTWSKEGLLKKTLSWGFLELLFHSLEDLVAQQLVDRLTTASQDIRVANSESALLSLVPAALARSAKKISHELRTPLQGIMGLSDLMHAAVHDASYSAINPAMRDTFQNLKEDIEAVQSSSRRAVDAADNVVQAYEMNVLIPGVKSAAGSEDQLDISSVTTRGTKRRLSESNLAEHVAGQSQSQKSSQRSKLCKVLQDVSSAPCKMVSQTGAESEVDLNGHRVRRNSLYSPVFLEATAHGLQFTEVRRCIRDIVNECVKREERLQTIRPVDFEGGQQIEVEIKGSNDEISTKMVTWAVDPGVPEYILVEQRDMAKMVSCVLHNALKFTDAGSVTLQIQSCPKGRSITINIKDTGPGISPGFRSEIFKPFTQEDDSISRRKEGLGLGLVVAKGLAKRLRGEVKLISADVCGPNRGTEFEIRIPISPSADSTPTSLPHQLLDISQERELERSSTYPGRDHSTSVPTNSSIALGIDFTALPSNSLSPVETATPVFSPLQQQNSQRSSSLVTPFSDHDCDDYCFKRPSFQRNDPFEMVSPPIPPDHSPSKFPDRNVNHLEPGRATTNKFSSGDFDSNFAAEHPLNFLVAEDNTVNRKLLVKMLGKLGYDARTQIREACDGLEAVRQVIAAAPEPLPGRRCSSAPPLSTNGESDIDMEFDHPNSSSPPIDVILMDLWMPNMDGYEATEQILQICKKDKNGQGVYNHDAPLILAVTADATQAALEKAAKVGMGGLMLKPFGMSDLEKLVLEGWTKRQKSKSTGATDCSCWVARRPSFSLGDDVAWNASPKDVVA